MRERVLCARRFTISIIIRSDGIASACCIFCNAIMVEFGLKLEDNKVSEWSDKYIDYEELKRILKKASSAVKRKDELCKRKPELAEEIIQASKQGKEPNQKTPNTSQHEGMNLMDSNAPIIQEEETKEQLVDQVPANEESKPLLSKDNEKYASTMADKSDSLSSKLSRTLSGHSLIAGYFSNSKYEQRIREALEEIDALEGRFDESIHQQVRERECTCCCCRYYCVVSKIYMGF
jgi:hypothetical protein